MGTFIIVVLQPFFAAQAYGPFLHRVVSPQFPGRVFEPAWVLVTGRSEGEDRGKPPPRTKKNMNRKFKMRLGRQGKPVIGEVE